MYSNKKFYLSKYIFWRRQNVLRWIELGLCIACLTLAIIIFHIPLHITTRTTLLVVNASYLFITLVDVISWIQLRPMGYKTWILFATGAFLMFWLCGGLLIFIRETRGILICACVLYFLTGVTYLLDCLWVIVEYISWTRGHQVAPLKEFTDRAVSTCCLFEYGHYEGQPIKKRSKCPILVKPRNIVTVSYGGTFPVSKDQTPLPSPDTSRSSLVSSHSWRRSPGSISSSRSHGDSKKEFYRPDSRQKSADYKTHRNLEVVSEIESARPDSCRSSYYDPFDARISKPSTAQTLSRISEKTSKDSSHCSYNVTPRELDYNEQSNQNRGAQACDCPSVPCTKCAEELQPQRATHEELTKSTILEESESSIEVEAMSSVHNRFLKQESAGQFQQICNCNTFCKGSCCKQPQYQQQTPINVTPYYCKCKANTKEEVPSPKISDRSSCSSRIADQQEYQHVRKPTALDSELGQPFSEILGKRNGLDPDDNPKFRRRLYNRNLSCPSQCNYFRRSHDSSTATDIPRYMEKSSGHIVSTESHYTQVNRSDGVVEYFVNEKSTSVHELRKAAKDAIPCQIDEEVMAVEDTVNSPVQVPHNIFGKDAVNQAAILLPPVATVSVNTIPGVDDPLVFLNYVPHMKFYTEGIVHNLEPEMEPVDDVKVAPKVKPKPTPAAKPVTKPKTVPGPKTASAAPRKLQPESVSKEQVATEMDYKMCYKPCHHPPVCPICFAESKAGFEAQRALALKEDKGINTEPEKRWSLFRRKKK